MCELYPDLFIRTSQQGLQFTENTPSLSLEEACTRQWAIEGQIHTALESCKKEETDEILNRLKCVYKHVESCLSMVNEQKSALINRSSTNIDLNTNLFYKKMVEPLLNEVVSPLKKSADQIVCALSGEAFTLDTKEWTFDLLKLNYIEQVVTIHHMLWTHYSNHWTKFSSV